MMKFAHFLKNVVGGLLVTRFEFPVFEETSGRPCLIRVCVSESEAVAYILENSLGRKLFWWRRAVAPKRWE